MIKYYHKIVEKSIKIAAIGHVIYADIYKKIRFQNSQNNHIKKSAKLSGKKSAYHHFAELLFSGQIPLTALAVNQETPGEGFLR
ncbi:MAG: hypothetical protein ACI4W6_06820, partial [Acutalibacteraceae bacterium]